MLKAKSCLSSLFSRSRGFEKISYSQYAEDLIAWELLRGIHRGFYVEVGGFHPFALSNTYKFYLASWSGLIIEANPEGAKLIKKHRPNDKVVCCGVSNSNDMLRYTYFIDPAYNGFLSSEAIERVPSKVIRSELLPVSTLETILVENDVRQEISLLSIDVEGLDLKVLQGFDWSNRAKPKVIIAELISRSLMELEGDPVASYLVNLGYKCVALCIKSGVFIAS